MDGLWLDMGVLRNPHYGTPQESPHAPPIFHLLMKQPHHVCASDPKDPHKNQTETPTLVFPAPGDARVAPRSPGPPAHPIPPLPSLVTAGPGVGRTIWAVGEAVRGVSGATAAQSPRGQRSPRPHPRRPRHRLRPHQTADQRAELAAPAVHAHPPLQVSRGEGGSWGGEGAPGGVGRGPGGVRGAPGGSWGGWKGSWRG